MRLGVIAMTAAVLFVGGASEGAAQPYIQRTASDSVLVGSLTYPRFTFSVWNFGNAVDLVVATRLASTGPEDTCRVIRAVGPADWIGTVDASDGSVLWGRPSPSVPAPGGYISGFQVVVTPGRSSCYQFYFTGVLDEPFAFENACFGTDVPVPVARQSWGALKARYR